MYRFFILIVNKQDFLGGQNVERFTFRKSNFSTLLEEDIYLRPHFPYWNNWNKLNFHISILEQLEIIEYKEFYFNYKPIKAF